MARTVQQLTPTPDMSKNFGRKSGKSGRGKRGGRKSKRGRRK